MIRLALGFVLSCLCAVSAAEWQLVKSQNFELITDAGPGDGKRIAEYFEQVRDFFVQHRSAQIDSKLPVTIILFRNKKEFQPYAPSENAAAFYTGDEARDYIVMSGSAENERPVAVHEYMHLLMRRMHIDVPAWLDEGMAEVYSTIRPYGGKIVVGTVPKGRGFVLGTESWLPMDRVFAVNTHSEDYNSKRHGGMFYGQSWLAVHMLMLGHGYQAKFGEFLGLMAAGSDSAAALDKVYGKSVADFTRDLQAYYRADSLKGALFNTKFTRISGIEAETADDVMVELHLARVQAGTRPDEAMARLKRLATASPDRWEVHDALGQVAWRRQDREQARSEFAKAVALNPPAWNVYWDYARLFHGERAERDSVRKALEKTLELRPEMVEARVLLADHLVSMDRFAEALAALDVVKAVTPDKAVRFFLVRAYALMRLDKIEEGRLAALNALKYATETSDKDQINNLMDYYKRRRQAEHEATRMAGVTAPEVDAPAPPDAVAAEASAVAPGRAPRSHIAGQLELVECGVNNAILQVRTGEGKQVRLQIYNPDAITIRRQPGSSMNLTCGPQQPARQITVEYLDRVDAKARSVGEVRAIAFEEK